MTSGPDLSSLPLGGWRWFHSLPSTNTEALLWVEQGAPDLALVAADEQTAGRGRMGRSWFTPPGAALAFSLVLRGGASRPSERLPKSSETSEVWSEAPTTAFTRLTGLGALAVCQALQELCGLPAQIKWPNDVLLDGRKTAGILVEAAWQGDSLLAAAVGIGVNVTAASVPPDDQVIFPAACVESALGRPQDRWELLDAILRKILYWRPHLASSAFLHAWEENLAFRGLWVTVVPTSAGPGAEPPPQHLLVLGLEEDGALLVQAETGDRQVLHTGEVRFTAP
jgi:BirA family biotin operon repressor/biotin-[acetyl-CoA-carboxylase] ligase